MAGKKAVKTTKNFSDKEVKDGKLMAVLSYIGILALIPFFAEKKNKFVIEHAKRGMNLFLVEIIGAVCLYVLACVFTLSIILAILDVLVALAGWAFGIFTIVVSIMGIVNVCNGEVKDLPVIGGIKIIK